MLIRKKIPGMSKRQHLELMHVLVSCSIDALCQHQQKWAPEIQRLMERLGMLGIKDDIVALATIHKMRVAHPGMTAEEKALSRSWLTRHDMSAEIMTVALPKFD